MAERRWMAFRLDDALWARIEKHALKQSATRTAVVKEALGYYFLYHAGSMSDLEQEVAERSLTKRERLMEMDKTKDMHDGTMMLATLWEEVVLKEMAVSRRLGILLPESYDRWIKLLEESRKPISKFEESTLLSKQLEMLIERLRDEKAELARRG